MTRRIYSPREQAEILSWYLLRVRPSKKVVTLYTRALKHAPEVTGADVALLNLAFRRPVLLGSLDSGLALVQPGSELRRRLYVLFAILETVPEYSDYFLPKKHNPGHVFALFARGLRAGVLAIVGVPMVLVMKLRA